MKTIDRLIDYALCYLNANWDENIEDDLGISYEVFEKLLQQHKKYLDEECQTI